MKVVYICAPFTAPTAWQIECNVRRAEEAALEVAKLGAMPLCPHTNTRFFHGQLTPGFWYEGTLELLRRCDGAGEISGRGVTRPRAERRGAPPMTECGRDAPGVVLLYDMERYAGERWAPGYTRGVRRWYLNAYWRRGDRQFADLIWTASGETYSEIIGRVPAGGAHFDRSGNYPSPMVPIEGWYFDARPEETRP